MNPTLRPYLNAVQAQLAKGDYTIEVDDDFAVCVEEGGVAIELEGFADDADCLAWKG